MNTNTGGTDTNVLILGTEGGSMLRVGIESFTSWYRRRRGVHPCYHARLKFIEGGV